MHVIFIDLHISIFSDRQDPKLQTSASANLWAHCNENYGLKTLKGLSSNSGDKRVRLHPNDLPHKCQGLITPP
ncbi:hypothetical protein DPMN_017471 [Dreissena polymorpha]|uniref:Uncharacterized protein n=1 Tax=Dreissena polymorpha TaxID=45954 RepID=A0A9D4S5G5_DREPO|nr:hypothetical protein DPMN_017471 [Dreissena polymorpha]